jgi:hypothetical protein
MPTLGSPNQKANLTRRLGLVLALLLSTVAIAWLTYGPHRGVPRRLLAEGEKHGWVLKAGSQQSGPLSTTLHDVKVSLRTNPHLTVEIGHLDIKHWPFMTPQASIAGVSAHLRGDPVVHLETVANAWFSPRATLAIGPVEMTYEHRPLGKLHLSGVELERHGDALEIKAAQARLGDAAWRNVGLSLERRKGAAIILFGGQADQKGIELDCFPSQGGTARWLLDVPHGPVRPWLQRLGLDLGDDFAAARAAGSLSLDIPDEETRPVHGRVQLVIDDWPLFAPADAEPMLGRSFSLLSNVVASADGLAWELPRVELTMPVFSLVGKGSLRLGRDKRLVLDVQGERTCRLLRGLLPPSRPLDQVRQFLAGKAQDQSAKLAIGWDTASPKGLFRPTLHFVPGCGLGPWSSAHGE